jgi:ankyrin repeat protein
MNQISVKLMSRIYTDSIKSEEFDTIFVNECETSFLNPIKNTSVKNLSESSRGETLLKLCCKRGFNKVSKYLIEIGVELDILDVHGRTALIFACKKGDINTVRLLVNSGASLYIVDKEGKMALDHTENVEIRDYLKERIYRSILLYEVDRDEGFLNSVFKSPLGDINVLDIVVDFL